MSRQTIPSYRLHRPSGRAVVTLNGKDEYLGPHGSPESKAAYQRLISEWLARGQAPVSACADLALAEVMLAYLVFARTYYRDVDGKPSREIENIKLALRPLEELHGSTIARQFGPAALKGVRQQMIQSGLNRRVINQRIGIIRRMIRWASSEELVPPDAYHGLLSVDGLRRGRSAARESEPVKPVPDADISATLPYLPPTLRAMVQLQRLTGMRSGELVLLRGVDLETQGSIWFYRPPKHKTAHHGYVRLVPIGPEGQKIIRPFLSPDVQRYLFSPIQAREERDAEKRAMRKTKVQPSQASRKKAHPKKPLRERYDTNTYARAVAYAIKRARRSGADVESWHPHQLRHNAATRIRRERGLDAARAVLGHRSLAIADTYAEIDGALAAAVASEMG